MTRALCDAPGCAREARYGVPMPGRRHTAYCARHAQIAAHTGFPLDTVGVCGHRAPVADMVARRPCPDCQRAAIVAALVEDGDAPEKAAYWAGRMTGA
jgi:hypothetical protein